MGVLLRDKVAEPIVASAERVNTTRRAASAPYSALRALTASAERIKVDPSKPVNNSQPYREWQKAAWEGYEKVGEVHYGFNLLANLLSRIRLYAGTIGGPNEPPIDVTSDKSNIDAALEKAAQAGIDELLAVDASSLIRMFSLNMSVPGECYLIQLNDRYVIRSCEEVEVTASGIKITSMRGASGASGVQTLPPNTYLARMWRPNPRYSGEPDSSMVGVQEPVTTLLMLERLMRGAIRSRLNAGMLFMPDGIAPATVTAETPISEPGADEVAALAGQAMVDPGGQFLSDLIESMSTPLVDEASAANIVPMVVTGSGDLGEKIRHITFERTSDEWLVRRADNALERILNGIDIPKEIVTGLQAVKYSNAVVIDENLYKSNIEPLALALADALTQVYLRPYLISKGFTVAQISKIVVWYDPSEIVTRPNAGQTANDGADRGLLSPSAWRRENGYAESDAPTETELLWMLINKLAALPENIQQAIFEKLFKGVLDIPPPQTTSNGNSTGVPPGGIQLRQPLGQNFRTGEQDSQRVAVQQNGLR